jgi:hypothetical protein
MTTLLRLPRFRATKTSGIGPSRHICSATNLGRFSKRPFEVKHFQTMRHCNVDVAHGLALLFGIGTRALPSWDPRTRWNNLTGGLAVGRSKRPSGLTSSIVPRGTSFHRWVDLELSPIGFDPERFSCCCRGWLPGPAELGAVNPYAVHDDGQPASQGHAPAAMQRSGEAAPPLPAGQR